MELKTKRIACFVLTLSMLLSAAACSKKSGGKDGDASGCAAEAQTVLETLLSLNMKKIKKIESFGDYTDDLSAMAENDYVKAVLEKATVEIDEDSAKEKKNTASVDAVVKIPDYVAAYDDADGNYDDFVDAIEGQKEKKYNSIEVTVTFDVDDGEYTLSNADEIIEAIFEPELVELGDDILTPPDTEPTDTEPVDTTKDTQPTDTTKDTQPTDTTKATTQGPATQINIPGIKKNTLNDQSFRDSITKVDSTIDVTETGLDELPEMEGYNIKKCLTAFSNDYTSYYLYYQCASTEDAKTMFSDSTYLFTSDADMYEANDDWGYLVDQDESFISIYYWSGDSMVIALGLSSDDATIKDLETFMGALAC
ncbi:MAG: hypothetical protein IK020_00135 [Clostridiales bacterium]|nr:hypothetical protein [Clostridiales bacterium]